MTRILVIDDDAASRAALTRLLTQSGYDVRTATNGNEGLRRLPMVPTVRGVFPSSREQMKVAP